MDAGTPNGRAEPRGGVLARVYEAAERRRSRAQAAVSSSPRVGERGAARRRLGQLGQPAAVRVHEPRARADAGVDVPTEFLALLHQQQHGLARCGDQARAREPARPQARQDD
jgi:hypothetical protein